jgi:SIR2-like domain
MNLWILGAGFSARLGGPMLNDLLSKLALDRLVHDYPETWLAGDQECAICVSVLAKGIEERLWNNAEEYVAALGSLDPKFQTDIVRLSGLDRSALHTDNGRHYDPVGSFVDSLYARAIGVIAAQCIDFVHRAADDLESWLAYDRWTRSLPAGDVLISFNYDTVVEEAFRRNRRPLTVPNQRMGHGIPIRKGRRPLLLKLHGSVDGRDTIPHPPEPHSIANLMRNVAMLAVPGISKASDAETDFDLLWEYASKALRAAKKVVLVGYRCPPSDEKAKAMLVDSLRANPNRPSVDIVLGPGNPVDAQRIVALLTRVGLRVRDTGMWAEDYLTIAGVGRGWETLDTRE